MMPRSNTLLSAVLAFSCILSVAVSVSVSVSVNASTVKDFDPEAIFLATPSAADARTNLEAYTSVDHVAGTEGDYETAVYTAEKFKELGIDAEIIPFRVGLNYPIDRSLVMTAPTTYTPGLTEPILPEDPTSDNRWRNMSFNGYGASGDVTGELVYVNYGSVEDFQRLASMNISVINRIVIARYGKVFRGLKVKNAQDHGAIGVLIYSDPMDDGSCRGPVYPEGRWRPPEGIQRGSVQFLSICSGDPFFVERDPSVCGMDTADLIPRIASLPLSYGDAQPLLEALAGTPAPADWVGGLDITYNIGPGPATVHLAVNMNYTIATLWNVVATIPGSDPDPQVATQEVLIGNHRDAWVLGSTDPNSGTVAMLEVAHGLGALLKAGWRPRRTIKLHSWDGEEYGLLGSTQYGEKRQDELLEKAIIYMNVDVAVTAPGYIVALTPSLNEFLTNVTKNITDPETQKPLYDVWNKHIGRLGSGTDFAVFLHHLGIASTDMGFRGNDSGGYGVYHSVYDSFTWTAEFGDPTFEYHKTMAQLWGLMTLRMADARVLPFRYPSYAQQLSIYLSEAQQRAVQAGMDLNFHSIERGIAAFTPSAKVFDCYRDHVENTVSIPEDELLRLNQNLYRMERYFIDPAGLPGRPWFRHVIQAPGLHEGYAAQVFPGLYDAIGDGNVQLAQQMIQTIGSIINGAANKMDQAVPYQPQQCRA